MCRSYVEHFRCLEVWLAHKFALLFAVIDGNHDYALLPGLSGNEINCGDSSFTLDSLENKALAKAVTLGSHLSMSLLLGLTMSLNTLTVITNIVSMNRTEHMPENFWMDSPTNLDFFGYRVIIMIAVAIPVVASWPCNSHIDSPNGCNSMF